MSVRFVVANLNPSRRTDKCLHVLLSQIRTPLGAWTNVCTFCCRKFELFSAHGQMSARFDVANSNSSRRLDKCLHVLMLQIRTPLGAWTNVCTFCCRNRKDPSSWPRGTLYAQKLALTLPTIGSRSVGKVYSRTQTTGLFKKILHGLSPRSNYTDRATAACRRSDCQLLQIEAYCTDIWFDSRGWLQALI
jgi:hypothetical protein